VGELLAHGESVQVLEFAAKVIGHTKWNFCCGKREKHKDDDMDGGAGRRLIAGTLAR
jgi:hypothetical protein